MFYSSNEEGTPYDRDINYTCIMFGKSPQYQFGLAYSDSYRFGLDIKPEFDYLVKDSEIRIKSETLFFNESFENRTINDVLSNPSVRYYSPTPRHFFPGHEYDFVFSMSEPMISEDDLDKTFSKFNITLTAVSLNGYDKMAKKDVILGEEAVKMSTVRNVRLIDNTTIGATIKTSENYAHDHMDYFVHFNGLKGAVSLKTVTPFRFMVHFFPNNGGTNTCSKMFGKGTLYVAGRPVLITDGDIRNGGANDNFVADGPNGEISGKHATSSDIALVAT